MTKIVSKIAFARNLRKNQTDAEKLLWMKLRNKQFMGLKFRRQQTLGLYIADFVSFECRVIIEVDGGQHNTDKNKNKDRYRTEWLEEKEFRVLRFWNNEIMENIEGVLESLSLTINPHPNPLPQGEGEVQV